MGSPLAAFLLQAYWSKTLIYTHTVHVFLFIPHVDKNFQITLFSSISFILACSAMITFEDLSFSSFCTLLLHFSTVTQVGFVAFFFLLLLYLWISNRDERYPNQLQTRLSPIHLPPHSIRMQHEYTIDLNLTAFQKRDTIARMHVGCSTQKDFTTFDLNHMHLLCVCVYVTSISLSVLNSTKYSICNKA